MKQAIEAATDEQLPITVEVIPADMTGDGQVDILTHINLVWGPTFAEILSLFACDERGYTHLDSVSDGNFYNASPAVIETAVDLNHNVLPDIVVRRPTVEGTKGFELNTRGNMKIASYASTLLTFIEPDPPPPTRFKPGCAKLVK